MLPNALEKNFSRASPPPARIYRPPWEVARLFSMLPSKLDSVPNPIACTVISGRELYRDRLQ
jgi:hypothetical protein